MIFHSVKSKIYFQDNPLYGVQRLTFRVLKLRVIVQENTQSIDVSRIIIEISVGVQKLWNGLMK